MIPASAFKALRVHQTTEGLAARFDTLSSEDLSPGEVLIRVAYSGINFKDALAVTGKGRVLRSYPRVAGIDLSGRVVSSSVPGFSPGQPVLVTGCLIGEAFDGGFAEYARVAADSVVPLPDGLSLAEAMAIGTAGFTAALALRRLLENHQTPEMGPIAITGPTGGVGSIAINLFKRAGFSVTALTGKKARSEDYLRKLGADEVIERQSLTLGTKPLENPLWGGAVDNLGGDTLAWLTRTVRPWGNIGSVGLAQSAGLQTTVIPFILRGVSLLGIHSVEMPRAWRLAIWERLASDWKPEHLMDTIVKDLISLDDVPAACEELMAAAVQGRYLVRIAGD